MNNKELKIFDWDYVVIDLRTNKILTKSNNLETLWLRISQHYFVQKDNIEKDKEVLSYSVFKFNLKEKDYHYFRSRGYLLIKEDKVEEVLTNDSNSKIPKFTPFILATEFSPKREQVISRVYNSYWDYIHDKDIEFETRNKEYFHFLNWRQKYAQNTFIQNRGRLKIIYKTNENFKQLEKLSRLKNK